MAVASYDLRYLLNRVSFWGTGGAMLASLHLPSVMKPESQALDPMGHDPRLTSQVHCHTDSQSKGFVVNPLCPRLHMSRRQPPCRLRAGFRLRP
eukprot:scaffold7989_cov403-Prasinococcus_capsulatus_cf.AAC.9